MNVIFQFILSLLWFFETTGFSFGAKEASGSSLIKHLGFSQNGGERLAETRVYDKLNRLRSVAHLSDAALNAVAKSFTYSYNSANQRTRVDREDGTHWDYGYDAHGHLTGAVRKQADGTALAGQHFAYQYDALGNRLSASFGGDAGGTGGLQTASYTASATGDRNQYAAITAPGVVLTTGKANLATAITVNGESAQVRQGEFFSHQTPVSNSTGPAELDITVTATTGGQSDSVTRREFVDAASRSLTHDADGNLLFDGYRDYTWDAENRLLSVQTRAGLVPTGGVEYRVAYAYDYAGRRIHRLAERKVGNAWYLLNQRSYLYDGWNVVAECSDTAAGARQVEQSYLWGLDISGTPQGAGGVGGLLAIEKHHGGQAGIHFASHDGNGNVVALTNAADGTLSASYEYDPFGNLLEMSGAFAAQNPYRFSTKRQDELTGFYDYGYRTYDPGTGRWLSRDPIQEDGGLNLYGFVGNDGVNLIDILGREPTEQSWLQQFIGNLFKPFKEANDAYFEASGDAAKGKIEASEVNILHDAVTHEGNDLASKALNTGQAVFELASPDALGKSIQAMGAIYILVKRGGKYFAFDADCYRVIAGDKIIGNKGFRSEADALKYADEVKAAPPKGPIQIKKRWTPFDINDPRCKEGCETVATKIKALIGGTVYRIKPGRTPNTGAFKGKNWEWSHHEVVVKDGKVYDAFTGSSGVPIDKYKEDWEFADDLIFGF